jgi:hypothetical protein
MDRIEPVVQETHDPEQGGSIAPQRDLNMLALKGYFGIEHPTSTEEEKLSNIYQLVTGGEVHEMARVLLFLRHTENKLGMAPLGTSRLDNVLQYLTVQGKINEMNAYKETMEQ